MKKSTFSDEMTTDDKQIWKKIMASKKIYTVFL